MYSCGRIISIAVIVFAILCWGCGDNTSEVIIERGVQDAPLFRVMTDGLIGYIDSTGREVIAPQFYAASDFSEGFAAVRKDGLYGYIDITGAYTV